tara:strand:+ start:315 stop:632 length:318 start_codon:yes stop_codon:yes gene_type:complete
MQLTDGVVLLKAVSRACQLLDLEPSQVADLEALVAYLSCTPELGGVGSLSDRAQYLICIFQALIAITGSTDLTRAWLRSQNTALGDCPQALLSTSPGLMSVEASV